jgi:hypothetical protein
MNEIYKHGALTVVALDVTSGLHGVRPYVKSRSRTMTEMQGLRFTLISLIKFSSAIIQMNEQSLDFRGGPVLSSSVVLRSTAGVLSMPPVSHG